MIRTKAGDMTNEESTGTSGWMLADDQKFGTIFNLWHEMEGNGQ